MATVLVLLVIALLPARAAAQSEAAPSTANSIPPRYLDRPLLPAPGHVRLSLETGVCVQPQGLGETAGLALDVGVTSRIALGLYASMPVNPQPDFGLLLMSLEIKLHPIVALRLDAGAGQTVYELEILTGPGVLKAISRTTVRDAVIGLGAPLRVKLNRMVALVSGGEGARRFGSLFRQVLGTGTGSTYLVPNDIVMVQFGDASGLSLPDGNKNAGKDLRFILTLPVGLVVQPHPAFRLAFRTGFQQVFTRFTNGDGTDLFGGPGWSMLYAMPVELEAVVSPIPRLDIGATAHVRGDVGASDGAGRAVTTNFGAAAQVTLWIEGIL